MRTRRAKRRYIILERNRSLARSISYDFSKIGSLSALRHVRGSAWHVSDHALQCLRLSNHELLIMLFAKLLTHHQKSSACLWACQRKQIFAQNVWNSICILRHSSYIHIIVLAIIFSVPIALGRIRHQRKRNANPTNATLFPIQLKEIDYELQISLTKKKRWNKCRDENPAWITFYPYNMPRFPIFYYFRSYFAVIHNRNQLYALIMRMTECFSRQTQILIL